MIFAFSPLPDTAKQKAKQIIAALPRRDAEIQQLIDKLSAAHGLERPKEAQQGSVPAPVKPPSKKIPEKVSSPIARPETFPYLCTILSPG